MVVQYFSTFISGILVGVSVSWQLSLVILCVAPFLAGLSAFTFKVRREYLKQSKHHLKWSIHFCNSRYLNDNIQFVYVVGNTGEDGLIFDHNIYLTVESSAKQQSFKRTLNKCGQWVDGCSSAHPFISQDKRNIFRACPFVLYYLMKKTFCEHTHF